MLLLVTLLVVVLDLCHSTQEFSRLNTDPELHYDARQLVTSKGYPFEEHFVETDDHYVLRIHRIPHGRNPVTSNRQRPAVFVQHGLLSSSDDWLINLANESLAYILADASFDVWLGNQRGNKYSRNNTRISTTSGKFWDFSFHEMAKFDIPAMLDYVSNKTGQTSINYVGHSEGTLVGFIAFSEMYPEWARQRELVKLIGIHEFLPSSELEELLAQYVCGIQRIRYYCEEVIFLIAGFDRKNLNETRVPVYLTHSPAGTSAKNMEHFGQMVHSGKFQQFDYGYIKNLFVYGSLWPPVYHPEFLNVPTFLYTGDIDILADPTDVARLKTLISHTVKAFHEIKGCDHLDFSWGLNAPRDVYPILIGHLNSSYPISD